MTDLIVNLAPTGITATRATGPNVPLAPSEVVTDVLACADIGITSVHLHARDESGRPTWHPGPYAEMIAGIRAARPDLVIGVSCSGREFGEFEQRSAVLDLTGDLKPDMASLTLSSLNFARGARLNAPDMVRRLAEKMRDCGIRPELEAFDLGMVNDAKYLIEREVLEPRTPSTCSSATSLAPRSTSSTWPQWLPLCPPTPAGAAAGSAPGS